MDADQQLMARVRDGDREAFAALYGRFSSPLMRFLYRLCGDRTLAEDLTQDVFLKVWRAAGRWRPVGKVSTWLFQIAKHHAWNTIAKRRRRALLREQRPTVAARASAQADARTGHQDAGRGRQAADQPAPSERVHEHLAQAETVHAIRAAVIDLPPRLRLVFVLVRLEGVSYAEAAEIAEIPVGTVKSRAAAAEALLRQRLRHLQEPSPGREPKRGTNDG